MAVKMRGRPAVKGVATADRVLAVVTAFKKATRPFLWPSFPVGPGW